jgi:hypothetical protein
VEIMRGETREEKSEKVSNIPVPVTSHARENNRKGYEETVVVSCLWT